MGDWTCQEKLQPGASCPYWEDPCVDGYACVLDVCEPEKGLHGFRLETTECAAGLRCDKELETCEPQQAIGDPCRAIEETCILDLRYGYTTDCEIGLRCVCTLPQGCFTMSECDSGSLCCADENNVVACTDSMPVDCKTPMGECAVW